MKPKIVVTRVTTPAAQARIERDFDAVMPEDGGLGAEAMLAALERSGAGGLMFNAATPLTAALIARLPATLKVAATTSVGFDHIDVAAARARGLVVTNTPGVLDAAVADFAMLLILAAMRRLLEYDRVVRAGWGQSFGFGEFLGREAAGRTLGILGMGRIGQALARRARAFDMTVIYHNRRPVADLPPGVEAEHVPALDDFLARAEVLSLHAPMTPATAGLLNARTIALLPPGAVVVNTARGGLVEDEALIAALRSGHVSAAGLDVFSGEPRPDPRYATLPNVVLAPHMGSATEAARTAMAMLCLDNIAAVLSGHPALTPL